MQKYSKNCYNMAKYCHNLNSFDTDIQKKRILSCQLHISNTVVQLVRVYGYDLKNCNGQSLSAPVACPLDELESISLQFPLHSVKEPEICLNQQKSADK